MARGTHSPAVRVQAPGTARGSHSVGACPLSCAGVLCSRSPAVPFMTQQKSLVALWPLAAQGCLLPWLCHLTLSFPLILLCGVQCKALLQGESLFQEVWKNDPGLFSDSTTDDSPWTALSRVLSLAWVLAAWLQKIFCTQKKDSSFHFTIQSFFQNYLL